MAQCETGYLCEVCGGDVEGITDSDLYLRYVLGEIPIFVLHQRPERHIRCNPALAQYIVDPKFEPVSYAGPFSKCEIRRRVRFGRRAARNGGMAPASGIAAFGPVNRSISALKKQIPRRETAGRRSFSLELASRRRESTRSACSRRNTAVDARRRQVRGLVVHPNSSPVLARLTQVFGLIDQHVHALIGIAWILVKNAPGVGQTESRQPGHEEQTPHDRPPCRQPNPRMDRPPRSIPPIRSKANRPEEWP